MSFIYKDLVPGIDLYPVKEKRDVLMHHVRYMLARTQSMFKYDGLPEMINRRNLELKQQTAGYVGIADYAGHLYAFEGSLGGEPDANRMPTLFIVANPALKMSKTYKINEDCVIIPNDSMYVGLLPLLCRYGSALTENELSMFIASVMARMSSLISAGTDQAKASGEEYLQRILKGDLGVALDSAFIEGLKTQPYASAGSANNLGQLIEYEQYLRASEWHELGINANFNMKREALNSAESGLNQDALFPFIDDMLKCRKEGWESVNDMFGTNVTVELASSWADNRAEVDAALSEISEEPEQPDEQTGGDENAETT